MPLRLLATSRQHLAALALLALAMPLTSCGGGSGDAAVPVAAAPEQSPAPSADSPSAPSTPAEPKVDLDRDDAWGAAPSATLARNPEGWLPAMAEVGITTVRNFDGESPRDKLRPITAIGMTTVGILQWSPGEINTLPVDDLAGWAAYVAREVRRYKGRVKYWEIWNEPPNFTVDTSPVSYAKVVAAAYAAAKAADPTVQLGLAAKSNHVNFLAESIAAGAADNFDFVTLHPYEVASHLPLGWEGAFMAIVPRLREMLRARNPARAEVPVWFTEIGASAAPRAEGGLGPQGQADVLAKIFTMGFAQGVARIYWFDPRDSEGLTMGLTTADGSKRPAWHALRSLRTVLGARPRYVGWTQPGNAWYGFVFEGPQGVVLSAWTRPGASAALALGSDVQVVDPHNGATRTTRSPTLTEAPTLLVAPAGSAQAAQWLADARANIGKAFPWNGDHGASAAVQLTAGGAADGVFMVNPPPVTVVGGVAEFSLVGTIGSCYAVDPTFLSYAYAGTPIRISAVVRGHGGGAPGFDMLYESTAPIAATDSNNLLPSGSGWFNILGTTFYEKTWTLPDARFVGLYGYNFCFYSIGPAHEQYSIRQVTVSR